MAISFELEGGDFKKTIKFFEKLKSFTHIGTSILDKYGKQGVRALSEATPKDSGLTASSWDYRIVEEDGVATIEWTNSNIVNYVPIAVILQYGHATRNGGWVEGRDYINPAIQPIFDKIADHAWREISRT